MTSNVYENLGNQMKAMKKDRDRLRTSVKDSRRQLRSETSRMLTDAQRFVVGVSTANAELASQTRQTLAPVTGELKAQGQQMAKDAAKMMAGIRGEVSSLKAEAASMIGELAEASRQRAAGWRDVVRNLHNNGGQGQRQHSASATGTVVAERPMRAKASVGSRTRTNTASKAGASRLNRKKTTAKKQ